MPSFPVILATAPFVFQSEWFNITDNPYRYIFLAVIMFCITFVVVLVSTGVRKIPVQYAKRVIGRKVYGGQASHIPLRILTTGVMPIIFAQALMFLPNTIASFMPDSAFGDSLRIYLDCCHEKLGNYVLIYLRFFEIVD